MEKAKRFFKALWTAHGAIGKTLTILCCAVVASGLTVGLITGTTKCAKANDVVYTNFFLGEECELHDGNYVVTVTSAETKEEINVLSKSGAQERLTGHYADIGLTIYQKEESKEQAHTFDRDDFKLKDHTGVYLPLNDIGSIVDWNMIDIHIDNKSNGFVISSADITTQKAVNDFQYVGKAISPGQSVSFHVFIPISNPECFVETSLMVLEVDFIVGGIGKQAGQDIILKTRPANLSGIA